MIPRVVSFVIGYICGNLILGFLLGEAKGVDIRKEGSGNVGATNTMRTLGKKFGILTLLCDILKVIVAGFISWLIFKDQMGENSGIIFYYAGIGAVFGHMFPFYMIKSGGKGVASTLGLALMTAPAAGGIALLVFIIVVLITRYVSLGSIIAAITYFVCVLVMGLNGWLGLSGSAVYEAIVIAGVAALLIIVKHHANIGRLIKGTENRFSLSKKDK